MSIDYRLLSHFQESRSRLEAARRALPENWRADPRPEAQVMNEFWVGVIARSAHGPRALTDGASVAPLVVSIDDR
jgi:hypothetical protein